MNIQDTLKNIQNSRPGIVLISEFGSTLYGTAGPDSDVDYKGIFIPSYDELVFDPVLKHFQFSTGTTNDKNSKDDVDIELYTLKYFCDMAMSGQTAAIDLLHSNKSNWIFLHDHLNVMEELLNHRKFFISKNIIKFVQYAQHQAAKYGIKGSRLHVAEITREFLSRYLKDERTRFIEILNDLKGFVSKNETYENKEYFYLKLDETEEGIIPHNSYLSVCGKKFLLSSQIGLTYNSVSDYVKKYGHRAESAKNNNGIDFKAISHAFRCAYQVVHIIEDGGFEYPLPETEFIIRIKQGNVNYTTIAQQLEELIDDTKLKLNNSSLPDNPDIEKINSMIIHFYKEHQGCK